MKRTIPEIIQEVNTAKTLSELVNLWNEIACNKYIYPHSEIWEAREEIVKKALSLSESKYEIGLFVLYLTSKKPIIK